jgi:hypothetical protein
VLVILNFLALLSFN